jgi:hypothetical protein
MPGSDIEYYRRRLAQERVLEARSESGEVRNVHRKLADLYAERLARLGVEGENVVALNRTAS